MIVRSFSMHFVQRYMSWRKEMPSIEAVNALIEGGQQLRPQIKLIQELSDGTSRPYLLLAEYWNHEAGVVLRIDESLGKAVTLICAGRTKEKPFRRAKRCDERNS